MLLAAFPHDHQHHQPQRGVRTQQPMPLLPLQLAPLQPVPPLPVPLQQEPHA
jgi:hypothetical protein